MPPPPTRRTVRKTLRLAPKDGLAIKRKAAVGLPVSAYVRALGLGRRPRARRRFRDNEGIVEVNRIGINVLQLRRVAEVSGDAWVHEDLEATIEELRGLLDVLHDDYEVERE